jgi:hypothetical protein
LLRYLLLQCRLLLLLLLQLSMAGARQHLMLLLQMLRHFQLLLQLGDVTAAVAAACYPRVTGVSSAELAWQVHSCCRSRRLQLLLLLLLEMQ